MVQVLFVCLGNICRSPMAEAVFRKMVDAEGLNQQIYIDSAATSSWEHGNPVQRGTLERLAKGGIRTVVMYSRILNDDDLSADYIIGMDESNIINIEKFLRNRHSGRVNRLLEYAGEYRDILDPWYTDDYETAYRDIREGCAAILKRAMP